MEFFWALFLYVFSLLISVGFHTKFYFRGQKSKLLKSFLYMQGMIFIWIFGKVFILLSPNKEISWFFTAVQYFSVVFFGNVFLNFAYYLVNNKRISFYKQLLLVGISAINYTMLITNNWHHLVFTEFLVHSKAYGPYFYFHVVYSYLIITIAYTYLLRGLYIISNQMNSYSKTLFTVGLILPLIANVLHVFKLTYIEVDITPIMFNVTFLIFGYVSYRYKFLDIKRIATQTVFENIQEGILVLDNNRYIVKFNKMMQKYVEKHYLIDENIPLDKLLLDAEKYFVNCKENWEVLTNFLESGETNIQIRCQLVINERNRIFLLHCEKIKERKKKGLSYTLLRFVEISKYEKVVVHLEEKNVNLAYINKALAEELSVTKRLTSAKERNRISKELHDILGHSLTMIISMLEVSKAMVKIDRNSSKEKILQTKDIARDSFLELKKSIIGNKGVKMQVVRLIEDIEKMAQEVESLGTKVEVFNRHNHEIIEPKHYDTIYRICQEGLTNAIRHGKSKSITVALKFWQQELDLIIADNGRGCSELIKGNGLLGMAHRVKELKGSFSCGSPEGEGFNIHIKIPLN